MDFENDNVFAEFVGDIIRDLRIQYNFTQEYICKRIGVSQSAYSKYEKGQAELPARCVCKLSELYGVPTDYIMGKTRYSVAPEVLEKDVIKGVTASDVLMDIYNLNVSGRQRLMDYLKLLKLKYLKRR